MLKYLIPFALFVAGVTAIGGLTGLWITAVLLIVTVCGWSLWHKLHVQVPEMEVAVLMNKKRRAFSRFLPAGRHHFNPLRAEVTAFISTAPMAVKGRSRHVQMIGGLSVDIAWTVSFRLHPLRIKPAAQARLARSLPTNAGAIAEKHLDNCLRHLISDYSIEDICRPGFQKQLERQLRRYLRERLGTLGFEITRVMIGMIDMPAHVRTAIEAAHEKEMQTEHEAKALARIQAVIRHFSDADMQRLIELERIHMMGQNGVALPYLSPLATEQMRAPSCAKTGKGKTLSLTEVQ